MHLPKIFKSKTPKVYKNKKLNNANFSNFNHNDYQVFLHLISKIGGTDYLGKYLQPQQLQREHLLTAKEFSEIFNVSLSNCYGILKRAIDKLMKTDIKVEKPSELGFWRINICSKAEYNEHQGSIIIKFTDDIMPYLAQVKRKFLLYNLKELANFGSLYTTRLYEVIQEFKETGWATKSVDQLREIFAVGNKFKLYGHFKINTFVHACQEINDNYNMNLKFEEIKAGRKVVAIKFSFKPTKVIGRVDQAGNVRNTYLPPEAKKIIGKTTTKKTKKLSQMLEDQSIIAHLTALEPKQKSPFLSAITKIKSIKD